MGTQNTPEGRVKNAIKKWFDQMEKAGKPCHCFARQAGGFAYKKGLPDLYAVYDGRHIEIEVKAGAGTKGSMQEAWERRIKTWNSLYICCWSLDELKKFMLENFGEIII